MASRYSRSEVDIDDRRTTRGGRHGDRYSEEDITFRRGSGAVPQRSHAATKDREDDRRTPAFLRDDYGRSSNSGALVLRAREKEDIEFRRRRSPSPDLKNETEKIIIKRESRSQSRPAAPRRREPSQEREEIIIRREEREAPPRRSTRFVDDDREREEIIIRRDERESRAPPRRRYEDDEREEIIIRREERDRPVRPVSHERARSRAHSTGSMSDDEIIIRRGEREGRDGRRKETEEILIRRTEHSRSPSPSPSPPPIVVPERQVVYAPEIHQEVITHHRHVDHGYEVRQPQRVISRPPSPPSPPPRQRARSEERIEIRRSETRNGRREEEDIIIDRRERDDDSRSLIRNEREEIDIRRHEERDAGGIGARYARVRDARDNLWTEVTKDLVVKEAIEQMGYEYEENDDFYYIFKYMAYEDMARLVGLSDDIRKERHKRINEIRWENNVLPKPRIEPPPSRLAIEGPPMFPPRRDRYYDDAEYERYIERDIIYRGGRPPPPPPPGWRR